MILSIEKLIYGGDGLARLPADATGRGKAAFVPFVLGGEKVEAAITEQKREFIRAKVETVIEPSPHRIEPGCPYFGQCGGCHYQHAGYEHQLEIKKDILRETLRRTAKLELPVEIEVHPSPPWNYRNRSRLQVQTNPSFTTGYYKTGSHELLPIEKCPISSPLINRGIAAVWASGRAGRVPKGVSEIEFFADDTQLLIEVVCTPDSRRATVREWAEAFRESMPEIGGIAVSRKDDSGSVEKLLSLGADHLTYRAQKAAYRVSAGAFFQTNRFLIDELVKIATSGRSGDLALDLYAGVGLFSTALACDFRHIVSVESSQTSSADLAYNLPKNGEAIRATTEQYLGRADSARTGKGGAAAPAADLVIPDLIIVDPPRAGLGERVARTLAISGAPRVVYVSCDPATLARDLAALVSGGYRIEQVHLVDLFPQTFHIETVVHLAR